MRANCTHGIPMDQPCLRCELVTRVELAPETDYQRGVDAERARCRAIVLRIYGSDWRGNEALKAIDGG